MPAHPARGQPWFEAMKKAVAASLGCIYISPSSILTKSYPYKEYDDEGKLVFEGERQEEVVDGVESISASSAALLDNISFTALPGMLTTPAGPVAGTMPPKSGWIKGA